MSATDSFQPERRGSFRCPTTVEKEAVLLVKDKKFAAQILDESRDGLGVLSAENPGLKEGEVLEVQIGSSQFQAQVAKVRRFGSQFRLGLIRLGDLAVNGPKGSPWAAVLHNQQPAGHGASKLRLPSFAFGIWMAVGSAAAFGALHWSLSGFGKKGDNVAPAGQQVWTPVGASAVSSAAGGNAAIPRINSATPFSLVSASEYLQLSESQRLRILQIIARATASAPEIRRVSVTGSTDGLPPSAQAHLSAAMVEILHILDDSQRQRWRSLTAGI
ncbi:MAG: PilZ domain-containing protein [Pirellulales bacterium]